MDNLDQKKNKSNETWRSELFFKLKKKNVTIRLFFCHIVFSLILLYNK